MQGCSYGGVGTRGSYVSVRGRAVTNNLPRQKIPRYLDDYSVAHTMSRTGVAHTDSIETEDVKKDLDRKPKSRRPASKQASRPRSTDSFFD
jgi:hypothetical protein